MICRTVGHLLAVSCIVAAAVSCAHPNYETRVTDVGEGGERYTLTRVPVDRPPPPHVAPLPPGDAAVHETGVRKAETDWLTALKEHSPFALSDLTEDQFVLVSPDADLVGKDDFIALVRDGRLAIQSDSVDDTKVMEYGNAAVMTGVLKIQGTRDGNDISGSYRFTDTWIWKSGSWKKAAGVFLGIKE